MSRRLADPALSSSTSRCRSHTAVRRKPLVTTRCRVPIFEIGGEVSAPDGQHLSATELPTIQDHRGAHSTLHRRAAGVAPPVGVERPRWGPVGMPSKPQHGPRPQRVASGPPCRRDRSNWSRAPWSGHGRVSVHLRFARAEGSTKEPSTCDYRRRRGHGVHHTGRHVGEWFDARIIFSAAFKWDVFPRPRDPKR